MPQSKILILLAVHLTFGAGRLVLLSAQMQQAVHHHAEHLLACRRAIYAGVVGDGLHVDKYVATNHARALAVAVVEGDHIGEVVVTDEVNVHLAVHLR